MVAGILIASVLIFLFAGLSISAAVHRKREYHTNADRPAIDSTDTPPPSDKLAALIRLKTVSYTEYESIDRTEFRKVKNYFETNFPNLMKSADFTQLNDFGYIFHWEGTDADLLPVLLLAHFDVVPASSQEWSVPPFDGRIEDGYVWGRGAVDTKCTLAGMLEAAERLIEEGFQPRRTWYFVSSGDEETFGIEGAQKIAAYFEKNDISFEFVLDEGTFVSDGMISDIDVPLALLGISEKGYADIVLEAKGRGGHASVPAEHNPAAELSSCVSHIEKSRKKRKIGYTVKRFLHALTPYVSFWRSLAYANLWLFTPLIKQLMAGSPQTRALIETTSCLTILHSGEKENVIPSRAKAVYNVRILPGDTVNRVMIRFKKIIRNRGVEIRLLEEREVNDPVWETAYDDAVSESIKNVIRGVFPEAVIVPYMSTVTTDSKYYRNVAKRIYRFVPLLLAPEDLSRIHGVDERISFDNLTRVLDFYTALIKQFS